MKRIIELENVRHYPIKMEVSEGRSEDEFFDFCTANKELRLERDKNGNIYFWPPHFQIQEYLKQKSLLL